MMSWHMMSVLGSIATVERMIQKFRELIDTDDSIAPDVRDSLHATLDRRASFAKERLLEWSRTEHAERKMPILHDGIACSE
ncbi:hypothetical protein [Bradyrhizobium sp. ARR65]|uniref:hypothetical protein n=1 Tax=Bradyrhizobium sp. ARR65 TaxID=1040989 RepID=UPI0004635395|nr:hypothetical protein [Bradyrhizobium sp. ARR65]